MKSKILFVSVIIIIIIAAGYLLLSDDEYYYLNLYDNKDKLERDFDEFLLDGISFVHPEIDNSNNDDGWLIERTGKTLESSEYLPSDGGSSTLILYLKEKIDTNLRLRMKNIPGIQEQDIEILLNNSPVTKIVCGREDKTFIIELPKKAIRIGSNELTLKYGKNREATMDMKAYNGSILLDWFFYDNFQLRRGIKRGFSFIPALSPPTGEELSIDIDLPDRPTLDFYFTLLHLNNQSTDSICRFIVEFEKESEREIIAEIPVSKSNPKSRRWQHRTIDLSRLGRQSGRLILRTESESEYRGFNSPFLPLWGNPFMYSWENAGEKPNIFLISIDTLRADHMGCYGYERNTTPVIDEFTKDAVLFEKHIASSSWTLPSHMSLLTSTLPSHHQKMHPSTRPESDIIMLPEILKKYNYFNFGYVTWIYVSPVYGFDIGFDNFNYSPRLRADYLSIRTQYKLSQYPNIRGFYFIHFFDPHGDYLPPPEYRNIWDKGYTGKLQGDLGGRCTYLERFGRDDLSAEDLNHVISLYDGEILYTDTSIGKLFKRLKKEGIYEDSLIIITSDHGEEFLERGGWQHTETVYQELIHVPLIIKFPQNKWAGKRVKTPVSQIDVMPTILDYLDIEFPVQTEGVSLLPLLENYEPNPNRMIVSETTEVAEEQKFAFINDWKKYIQTFKRSDKVNDAEELYDLTRDPEELNNLIDRSLPILQRFRVYKDKYHRIMERFYRMRLSFGRMKLDKHTRRMLKSLGYLDYH